MECRRCLCGARGEWWDAPARKPDPSVLYPASLSMRYAVITRRRVGTSSLIPLVALASMYALLQSTGTDVPEGKAQPPMARSVWLTFKLSKRVHRRQRKTQRMRDDVLTRSPCRTAVAHNKLCPVQQPPRCGFPSQGHPPILLGLPQRHSARLSPPAVKPGDQADSRSALRLDSRTARAEQGPCRRHATTSVRVQPISNRRQPESIRIIDTD